MKDDPIKVICDDYSRLAQGYANHIAIN